MPVGRGGGLNIFFGAEMPTKQFFALFHTFSEFFPQDFPLQNKGF